jgi:anti-anti-sigma factor
VPQVEFELTTQADGAVVVRGEVDMATAEQLRAFLGALVDSGVSHLRLVCDQLTFLDSSGIAVLVAICQRVRPNGELVMESVPAHVRRVLEITGVDTQVVVRP